MLPSNKSFNYIFCLFSKVTVLTKKQVLKYLPGHFPTPKKCYIFRAIHGSAVSFEFMTFLDAYYTGKLPVKPLVNSISKKWSDDDTRTQLKPSIYSKKIKRRRLGRPSASYFARRAMAPMVNNNQLNPSMYMPPTNDLEGEVVDVNRVRNFIAKRAQRMKHLGLSYVPPSSGLFSGIYAPAVPSSSRMSVFDRLGHRKTGGAQKHRAEKQLPYASKLKKMDRVTSFLNGRPATPLINNTSEVKETPAAANNGGKTRWCVPEVAAAAEMVCDEIERKNVESAATVETGEKTLSKAQKRRRKKAQQKREQASTTVRLLYINGYSASPTACEFYLQLSTVTTATVDTPILK